MESQSQLLLTSCILVLLPLVPAIVIFKAFPQTDTTGEGELYGMRWKFGGAFAAYLVVALILLNSNKNWFYTNNLEVWTVRGTVSAGERNMKNVLAVRSLPQALTIESDGSYVFKIIVNRSGDVLDFPSVLFELQSACNEKRSVRLDGKRSAGTFEALKFGEKIDITRNDNARTIEISPFTLGQSNDSRCAVTEN